MIEDEVTELSASLRYVVEQIESNTDKLFFVQSENTQLCGEIDLMRAVTINMDRRLQHIKSETTDLMSRSMRENIFIHNSAFTPPGKNKSTPPPYS